MVDKKVQRLRNQDIRTLLQLQQQRLQHLQSLSQGLLTAGITIVAVIATVATATFNQLPRIPTSNEAISNAASSFPIIHISPLIVRFSIVLGLFLSITYLGFSVVMFFTGLWKLFDVSTYRSINPDVTSIEMIYPEIPSLSNDTVGSVEFDLKLAQAVNVNRIVISKQYERFLNGSLRVPVGLMVGFLAYLFYLYSANLQLLNLLMLSTVTVVMSLINIESRLSSRIDILESQIPSLTDELLLSDEDISRWKNVRFETPEKSMNYAVAILSFILLTIWLVAVVLEW